MFGQPEWFRRKTVGWGLVPISWQGWAYTGAWGASIVAPFALLLTRQQPVEATIWMGLGLAGLLLDVRHVLQSIPGGTAAAAKSPQV
ncbi:MAG: hypothetical protein SFU86_03580 [Pirellulaceae bacterium]|nr:hypothetical protein [Pirellulaceae bacterium]